MRGWLVIAAAVTAIDIHAYRSGCPTLSCTFRTASRSHPLAVTAATVYLIAHLFGAIPSAYDPLTRLGGHR